MAIWKWFQRAYDNIDAWEMSPKWKKICKKVNDVLPEAIAKAVLGYIKAQYDKSESIAEYSLKNLRKALDEIIQ